MSRFIEVTSSNGYQLLVNVDQIAYVCHRDSEHANIQLVTRMTPITTNETYQALVDKVLDNNRCWTTEYARDAALIKQVNRSCGIVTESEEIDPSLRDVPNPIEVGP